ncbi:MAG: acyl-CoA dehydrogenase family protein [Sphingomonadales bacterium]|nr:acyl-CoA dehydrogenase family protein [Sphingomonadales bacterium]
MDESQTLILDMQRRFLADWRNGCSHVPDPDEAARFWQAAGELGLLGALAPEAAGGLDEAPDFAFEFFRQWGEVAAPGPLHTTLVAGTLLLHGTALEPLLAGIAEGTVRLTVPTGNSAPGTYPPPADAGADGAGLALLPRIEVLRDAPFATHVILPATLGGEPALLCVGPEHLAFGAPFQLLDGAPAATLHSASLDPAVATVLHRGDEARAAWLAATDRMAAAAACETVGLLRAMLDMTVAYARERKQFGQAVGSFQVVQHRLADMLVEVEQAHSIALAALRQPDAGVLVSAAKARVARAVQFVGDNAVQLHGGIGTTQELALSRFFRRANVLAREFGLAAAHLPRVEAAIASRLHSPAGTASC